MEELHLWLLAASMWLEDAGALLGLAIVNLFRRH